MPAERSPSPPSPQTTTHACRTSNPCGRRSSTETAGKKTPDRVERRYSEMPSEGRERGKRRGDEARAARGATRGGRGRGGAKSRGRGAKGDESEEEENAEGGDEGEAA